MNLTLHSTTNNLSPVISTPAVPSADAAFPRDSAVPSADAAFFSMLINHASRSFIICTPNWLFMACQVFLSFLAELNGFCLVARGGTAGGLLGSCMRSTVSCVSISLIKKKHIVVKLQILVISIIIFKISLTFLYS